MSENVSDSRNVCSINGCDKPAVIKLYRNNSRDNESYGEELRLCATHFIADLEERVFKNIIDNHLINDGECILVGLSGGKDSTALILILSKYAKTHDLKIIALTIDEGIDNYREDTVKAAVRLVEYTGVEHKIISFTELFGDTLDNLVHSRTEQACSICGVLRRRSLTEGARRFNADKIATGHNLDDEAQSVLMNMLRGDRPSLIQDTTLGYPGYFVPRIKPLSVLSEKEITTYLLLNDFFTDLPECPYAVNALRSEVRGMILSLESFSPRSDIKNNIVAFRDNLRKNISYEPKGKLNKCRICGELTSGDICQVCRVLNRHE